LAAIVRSGAMPSSSISPSSIGVSFYQPTTSSTYTPVSTLSSLSTPYSAEEAIKRLNNFTITNQQYKSGSSGTFNPSSSTSNSYDKNIGLELENLKAKFASITNKDSK
jgi:hypothetical protein